MGVPTQREIERVLAPVIRAGVLRKYRVNPDGSIEVECAEPAPDPTPASLIDWRRK